MARRVILLAIMIVALLASSAPPVLAWTTSSLAILGIREDYFYNYDFESKTASSTNVDWPVTMLFYNNAEVGKVKDIYWGDPLLASSAYARLNDGAGWEWDSDRGTKSLGLTCRCHLRVYATKDWLGYERMYNIDWGYYVLGTSHYDYYEWLPTWYSGFSEGAEEELCQVARDNGYTVFEDWSSFYNNEPYREEKDWLGIVRHVWSNNGYASAVNVP